MNDIVERLRADNLLGLPGAGIIGACREAADTIESLRQQLADAQREAAHWKNNHETEVRRARILKERTDMPIERTQAYEKWGEDQRRLATSQAREQQLRDGLSWIARVNALDYEYVEMAKKTLADVSQDASTLEAMIVKAGEVMRERCANEADPFENITNALTTHIAQSIRALPGVTLEDIK